MNNKKGQGALEYLLLIGGAVLIAVIVIALLVGMGGQSRETAQDQATKASKTLDQPQPATIVSVTPAAGCTSGVGGTGAITFNWQKLGEGGTYTVKVYDYSNVLQTVNITAGGSGTTLTNTSATATATITLLAAGNKCQDTYWLELTTAKNGQSITSTRMKFNWP